MIETDGVCVCGEREREREREREKPVLAALLDYHDC